MQMQSTLSSGIQTDPFNSAIHNILALMLREWPQLDGNTELDSALVVVGLVWLAGLHTHTVHVKTTCSVLAAKTLQRQPINKTLLR